MKESILDIKSFEFVVKIVRLYQFLCEDKKEFVLSKQLLRAGTSITANINEAQYAESSIDFSHKLKISQKECNETKFWLKLLMTTDYISENQFIEYEQDRKHIMNMLSKSIITILN
ncbi:MAG: four helix bundle protein [Bacteroidales bacterium]|jgi:four helix bundle protein|nr:four helix bundle protein [Bacteroidales bacterium]